VPHCYRCQLLMVMLIVQPRAAVVVHPFAYPAFRVTPVCPVTKAYHVFVHPHTKVERRFVVADWTPMWGPYLTYYEPKKAVIKEWVTSNSLADDISIIFYETDKDGNHMLEWSNGEIKNFITKLYQRKGLPIPDESTMYKMYQIFDEDKNGGLDAVEAQHLAQGHVMSLCAALLTHDEPKKAVIKEWVTSNSLADDDSMIFYEMDKDGNHMLEWNNGEIRNFISKVCQREGLPIPDEFTMYQMYQLYDENKNGGLDAVEAQHLAQGLRRKGPLRGGYAS